MSIRHIQLSVAVISLTIAAACSAPEPTATPASTPSPTSLPAMSGSGGGVIAFVSDRDGNDEIFLMNADGTDQRQLTRTATSTRNAHPAWSPDGSQIVYEAEPTEGRQNIWGMGRDGSDARQLTSKRNSRRPAWSPDGTRIAFDQWNGRNTGLCTISRDGADEQCLTPVTPDADFFDPAWSPDGTRIACALHSHPGGHDEGYRIHVLDVAAARLNAEDDNMRRLVEGGDAEEDNPTWSPDGQQIACTSVREGHWQIFVVDAGGTHLRQLTHEAADHLYPNWSPDGERIAFQANRDGQWDIYVMNVDGTELLRLTTHGASDQHPVWRP